MSHLSIKKLYICLLLLCLSISACSPRPSAVLPPDTPDLTIFTSQEKSIYEPIIKEYQERTGYKVHVEAGTFQDLKQYIEENTLADRYDVSSAFTLLTWSITKTAGKSMKAPMQPPSFQMHLPPTGSGQAFAPFRR